MWGWGVAQLPAILPGSLTIDAAAAPAGTLDALLVIAIAAAVTIGPSLALLFILDGAQPARSPPLRRQPCW